ncbi:MAG TPA: hypothetical protein DEH78_08590 [Solibacterales bacterium]|nr:hypothetical protein [Bryobacterales bacterium]
MSERLAYLEVGDGPCAGQCRVLNVGDVLTVGRSGRASWMMPDESRLLPEQGTLCWDGTLLHVFESTPCWLRSQRHPSPVWTVEPGRWLDLGGLPIHVWAEGAPLTQSLPFPPLEKLRRYLAQRAESVFAVIDASADPAAQSWLSQQPFEHQSLFQGENQIRYAAQAPYLVRVAVEQAATLALLRFAWGRSMLTLILDDRPLDVVRRHLRHFLLVRDPKGDTVYFRFYDPRVLHGFFASCDGAQLNQFFGGVTAWIAEKEAPSQFSLFRLADGRLDVSSGVLA